ncbi:MAG: hypothetical protein IJY11_01275 [Clostridia bacterium]|nr:hypothetical protein [Clostridia bacterium]
MLKLFGYFRDGAIIQRGAPIQVKGWCEKGCVCTLSCADFMWGKNCEPDETGKFTVEFPPVTDTESSFELTLTQGEEKVSVKVRFGDVYLTLGQSNMAYGLGSTESREEWLARAKSLPVAVFDMPEEASTPDKVMRPYEPQEDIPDRFGWREGESLQYVSAISVHLAVLASEKKGIPVGVVHTSMGGLSVESYIPKYLFEEEKEVLEFAKKVGRYQTKEEYNNVGGRNYTQSFGVYNEKIAPFAGLQFTGAAWYLGESSAFDFEFADMFVKEMQMMIKGVRNLFGDLPFVCSHIACEYYPYGDTYGYEYVNEALDRLQAQTEGVVSVPVYDIEPRWLLPDGERYYHPIHPTNKAPISVRLFEGLENGEKYPEIAEVRFEKGKAICRVKNAVGGLKGDAFEGFTLADEKGKYHQADAKRFSADEIEVTAVGVKSPVALTYAFMQYQDFCNVKDGEGRPMLPYRSRKEAVTDGYFFPPAFTVNGATEVYENCFGTVAGTARKVKVWKKGEIYDASPVKIYTSGEEIIVRAKPEKEQFMGFGVSPVFCLSGHKNYFDKFGYLSVDLCADKSVEFAGVVVRDVKGNTYRFDLKNGRAKAETLPVTKDYSTYTVDLNKAVRGDSAPVPMTKTHRQQLVSLEFCFTAKSCSPVNVCLKNVRFTDRNLSKKRAVQKKKVAARSDTQLPTN